MGGGFDWKGCCGPTGPWLALALIAFLPYLGALTCDFVYDDVGIIVENDFLESDQPWWRSVTEPYWPGPHDAGLYRPVTTLSYRMQLDLFGPRAMPFHLLNLILHAGVTLLVLALLRRLLKGRFALCWSIAALFAIHPLHTEAVTGVVGRAELFAALFGLVAYLAFLNPANKARWLMIGLGMALAIASKEGAIGFGLLFGAHRLGLMADGRSYANLKREGRLSSELRYDLLILASIVPYLLARAAVVGWSPDSNATLIDNPIIGAPLDAAVLTAARVLALGVWLTIWPSRLSADYSLDAIELERDLLGLGGLAFVALIAVTAVLIARRNRRPALSWSFGFYLALMLPVSNLLYPIGTIFGERLLYLPLLGLLAGIVLLVRPLLGASPRPLWGVILLTPILLLAGLRTWDRNRDWQSDRTLFASAVEAYPRSSRMQSNLGTALIKDGELAEAESHLRESLKIAPFNSFGLNGLGHLLIITERYEEAEEVLGEAVKRYPDKTEPRQRIGNLYLEQARAKKALEAFDGLLALEPRHKDGWIGRASALFMLDRFEESADAWAQAQALAGQSQDLRRHWLVALIRADRIDEALSLLRQLLAADETDAALQHELGRLMLRHRPDDPAGLEAARRAVSLEPGPTSCGTLLDHLLLRQDCPAAWAFLKGPVCKALPDSTQESMRVRALEVCSD